MNFIEILVFLTNEIDVENDEIAKNRKIPINSNKFQKFRKILKILKKIKNFEN